MGVCKSKSKQEQPELVIKTSTWQRDSHGLFDYEGKETEKKQFKGIGSFSLTRHEIHVEVKYDDDQEKLEESKEEETPFNQIAKIVEKNGSYWIYHSQTVEELEEEIDKNPESKLWRVVKYCKSRNSNVSGYKIQPEDLIKLGRVRFKVREIQSPAYKKLVLRMQNKQKKFQTTQTRFSQLRSANSARRKNSNDLTDTDQNQAEIIINQESVNIMPSSIPMNPTTIVIPQQLQEKEKQAPLIIRDPSYGSSSGVPLCRICLSEENDQINPLFSPCKCAGTMKFIHLNCLQEWLNSRKVTKETPFTKTFYWKNLECELCKTSYPNQVKMGDNKNIFLRVIQYELPSYSVGEEANYLVLESISTNTSKVIHVVNMLRAEEIKIGRGHDADVRVTDISVSRLHAVIKKSSKGYFFIEDNHSKFGSLVLVRNPIPLRDGDPNFIQAGRTMLEIQIKRPIKIFNSCLCSQNQNNNVGSKRSSEGKNGMTTKNGIDYFPEEFMPSLNKSRKSLIRNQSDSSRVKVEKQINMPTGFHSDINIEEAIVRDRQILNTPHEIEIEEDQIEPALQNNVSSRQIRNRSFIQLENNNNEEIKEEGQQERSQSRLKKKAQKLRNEQKRKKLRQSGVSSKGSIIRSQSKWMNSEEEKLASEESDSRLPSIMNQVQRNIENRNEQRFAVESDILHQQEEAQYFQSLEDLPIESNQEQQHEVQNLQQKFLEASKIIENQEKNNEEIVIESIHEGEKSNKKDNLLFQKVQNEYCATPVQNYLDDSLNGQDFIPSKHLSNNLFNEEPATVLSQELYHIIGDDQIPEKGNIDDIIVMNNGNSNLPTERNKETNDHNYSNRMRQSLRNIKSNSNKKEDLTYIEDEKVSDLKNYSIPNHQMISLDHQLDRSIPDNNNTEVKPLPIRILDDNRADRNQRVGVSSNLVRIPEESIQLATFEQIKNGVISQEFPQGEDQRHNQHLRQSIEEIKISTKVASKKRLHNMNKSSQDINNSRGAIDSSKDQFGIIYNQKAKQDLSNKVSNHQERQALDFYQSLSNFNPNEQQEEEFKNISKLSEDNNE